MNPLYENISTRLIAGGRLELSPEMAPADTCNTGQLAYLNAFRNMLIEPALDTLQLRNIQSDRFLQLHIFSNMYSHELRAKENGGYPQVQRMKALALPTKLGHKQHEPQCQ